MKTLLWMVPLALFLTVGALAIPVGATVAICTSHWQWAVAGWGLGAVSNGVAQLTKKPMERVRAR